ncbi:hypothetical protein DFH09DRAFT_973684, partial [Mycena vulgaris]
MEDFPITEAQIVGLFLESVFWGIYLITFVLCLRSLLFTANFELKRFRDLNWPMLVVSLSMCACATLDVAVGLMHNIEAFILYKGSGGATQEFSNISDWVNVIKTVDVIFQTTLGDGMLIYRCWIVYSKSWRVVALPILLFLGGGVCNVMTLILEANLHSNALVTSKALKPVITAFWILTIVLNILTTGLLVFRIWRVDRQNAQFGYHTASSGDAQPSRLRQAMRIIIESGLMYTTLAFVTFVTYITDSNSVYGTSDVEVQIVGIAFNLIIIRADRATEEQTKKNTLPLQVLRRPMASDSMGGVHVTVNRDFEHRRDTDVFGKTSRSLEDVKPSSV